MVMNEEMDKMANRIQELEKEIERKNKYIEDMDEIIDQLRKALEFYANEALNK